MHGKCTSSVQPSGCLFFSRGTPLMFLQRGAPLLFNEGYFYCGEKYFKLSVKLNVLKKKKKKN